MILFTEAHDHIAQRSYTLAIKVENWSTQNLRQIKHGFDSPDAISRMIAREIRSADWSASVIAGTGLATGTFALQSSRE
jgi:hypothetical protein